MKSNRVFNNHSRFNISPGSQADLSTVIAHYDNKNKKMEEERVARMKDGKVVSLYD